MLNFDNIKIESSPTKTALDFKQIIKPKLTANQLRDAKAIEPGNKVPTASYHQLAQWCDTCDGVKSFAHNPDKKKMICLTCKTIRNYGK